MSVTVIFVLSFISSIFILAGVLIKYFKCYWLISGYNLKSAEQKKNIDIVGLSKFIGNFCFFIAGVIFTGGLLEYFEVSLGIEITFGSLFFIVPYMIIRSQKFMSKTNKIERISTYVILGFVIVIFFSVTALIYYGIKEPSVDVSSEQIIINGMYGTKINLQDVKDVSLKNTIGKGIRKLDGFNFGNTLRGSFKISDVGVAKIYIYKGIAPYIYIYHGNDITIINFKDIEKTEQLHTKIIENWKE